MNHFHHPKRRKRIRGVSFKLQERARELRKQMTLAEQVLWKALRRKQLGVSFRRQHAVGRVILDFYCPTYKLVVEVDGKVHRQHVERDEARTRQLEMYGYRVIRFRNEEVLKELPDVLKKIQVVIEELKLLE